MPLNLSGLTGPEIEQVGQGSYLVNAVGGCGDCHNNPTNNAFLAGGNKFAIGGSNFVTARNLTPDTATGLQLTKDELITAIRTGKDFRNSPDGGTAQQLIVMPWSTFRWMSTPDLEAIYAYLKAIPAVSNTIPADSKGAAAAAQPVPFPTQYDEGEVTRTLPAEHDAQNNPIPDPGFVLRGLAISPRAYTLSNLTVQEQGQFGRGSYLVNAVAGCNDCHTNPDRNQATLAINTAQYLAGGRVFAVPQPLQTTFKIVRSMSADLLGTTHGAIANGTLDFPQFEGLLTSGMHVEDPVPTPVAWPMPVQHFKNLMLGDMESIFVFLKNTASPSGTNDKLTQPPARYCATSTDCLTNETCNTGTSECVGGQCQSAADCGACQTCTANVCVAPATSSTCLTSGI
ncbi:MAG TPA: hypothetical protein VLM85_31345 [Polyangiaceae bacterium]|nr:hypothetical protein [Polyangiaceae bacterium]